MGTSCPPPQLYRGLITLGLVVAYLALNLWSQKDRVRGAVLTLASLAYLYINWKHGFVRADGHQIGFYYAALTVIVTAPLILEEAPRFRWPKHLLLGAAGVLSIVSIEFVLPGLSIGILAAAQDRVNRSISFALGVANTHELYAGRLRSEQDALDLVKTKATVGRASVDVLGFEQAAAIYNGFNYQPRPVFQGYSAYTPYLSRLNYDYYASEHAPEYVLFKLQSIDYRLATMDDPHVLRLLIQRYTYQFSELGFTLWKRKPGAFDAASFEPKFIRTTTARVGQTITLSDLANRNIWVEVDYQFTLLGKLRRFLFKPPLVQLRIKDDQGVESVHRLPQPIGQAGFMLNPVVDDLLDFMRASGGTPSRHVAAITVECAKQDRDCLQDEVRFSFSTMPASDAGKNFFRDSDQAKFNMFADAPISYQAFNPPNEDRIDGRKVMVMHAPSEMVFEIPAGANEIRGAFGFIPGAYTNGGNTSGATFVITTSRGGEPTLLFERFLDPVHKLQDRGLQKFAVRLPTSSGRVFLHIKAGPYNENAFDWTAWTGIEFK
jgi:hypothetical protein